jgi:predicted acyltransferase (DUF342 family)
VSNGTVVVRNTIIANNITANSNVVVVGTANVGFLGVANTGVFGQSVSIGNNLTVTGNAAIGGDATVTEDLDVGGDFSVTGSADIVGDLDIIGSLSTATSLNVGTNSIVTGNGYFGGTLQAVGNVTVGGTLQATGNVLFSGPGTALFVANNVVSNGTIVARDTIIANNITANSNVVVVGTANVEILQVSNTGIFNQSISVGNNVSVGNNLTVTGNTTLGGVLSLGGTLQANGAVSVGTSLLVGGDTTILGNLGVTGDFTLTGQTIIDTDTFIVGATTPITTGNAYFGVYRGNTQSTLGTANANAYIRWAGSSKEWQLRDVDNSDLTTSFSKVLTANLITTSTATVSNSTFTSSWLTKNYVDTANTNLKSYTDNLVTTANTNLKSYSDALFAIAANTFVGTSGTAIPDKGVITYSSNNGIAIHGTANTIAISTSQDLRTTATPTFAGLTLGTGGQLAIQHGGTGATSASAALTALLPTGTTAGYVLTTGGPGNFYWAAGGTGGGGGAVPGTTINSTRLSYTGNGANTRFTTPTFNAATQLRAYINGVRQFESEYSANVANSTISFTEPPQSTDTILLEVDGYIVNPYYANNITYGPVTGGIPASANTIQLAIDSLESRKAALVGAQFTGIATGITVPHTTSNTAFATTQFVKDVVNSGNTFTMSVSGNAGTVTNGVYTNGSYANPSFITSLANAKITGLAASATTDTSNASNISTGTLAAARLEASGVTARTYGTATVVPTIVVDDKGRITSVSNTSISISSGSVSGLATSATTDTTNASNITSGTLAVARVGGLAASATTDTTNASNISSGTLAVARLGGTPTFTGLNVGSASGAGTGEIRASSDIIAHYSSDSRLKTEIQIIPDALQKLKSIDGVTFNWNSLAENKDTEKREAGVIAQQVQKVLPEIISVRDNGYLAVAYEKLVPLLIEAIKELSAEVEVLKGKNK